MLVHPLDPGQEREVAFARGQRAAWVNLTPGRRAMGAIAVSITVALVAGTLVALADGPWLWVGLAAGVLTLLAVLPHMFFPEQMLRATVRLTTPTADSLRKGDRNRSWPG